jgi:hypothetical protein
LSGQSAEAGTAALFTHEGYRYTVVTIASGLHGVEAGLWYVPPGDDTNTPAWNYFGRRTAGIAAEARDQVERDFKAWVEGQLEGSMCRRTIRASPHDHRHPSQHRRLRALLPARARHLGLRRVRVGVLGNRRDFH